MSGFSVGDRVGVLCKGTLYAANIIHVDADEGWCDAVYEIDNSVGVHLTAEEHGLILLPDREDQPEAVPAGAGGTVAGNCSGNGGGMPKRPPPVDKGDGKGSSAAPGAGGIGGAEQEPPKPSPPRHHGEGVWNKNCDKSGCTTKAKSRGLCQKHAAKSLCAAPGCTTNAQARGVCHKHGARGICSSQGCTTNAIARGVCTKHGAKGLCSAQGCTTNAQARGVCYKHGANGICSVQGCTTNAFARGVCHKHNMGSL